MRRANLNFVIDAVAIVAFGLLISTGFLVHYVLPAGSGHFSILWGMDRHEWGQLHFWIAIVLMASMVLHLFLHWGWIVTMVKGRSEDGSGMRVALSVLAAIAFVGLAVTPFFGKVEQTGEPPHKIRSTAPDNGEGYSINGSMTLADIERLTGIPPAAILRELGLPGNLSADEKLGRLRKEFRFEMENVREAVRKQSIRK
jgi:hypothetical protein